MRPALRLAHGIRAVIFDLDGVLLDNAWVYVEAARRALRHGDLRRQPKTVKEGRRLLSFVKELELGNGVPQGLFVVDRNLTLAHTPTSSKRRPRRRRREENNDNESELLQRQFLQRYGATWNRLCLSGSEVMPGAIQTLRLLRSAGIEVGLVTGRRMPQRQVENQLNRLGLLHFFGTVVTTERCVRSKPFPDQLLVAARDVGIPPCSCAAVGDTPLDVIAAKRAGMHPVALWSGIYSRSELRREGPAELLRNVGELASTLVGSVGLASVFSQALLDIHGVL